MEAVHTNSTFTTRILPPEDWAEKLRGTALEGHQLHPEHTAIVVVEDEAGQVVACWAAFDAVHVEGLWVHRDHRGRSTVARLLLEGMLRELRDTQVTEVMTNADTPQVEALLRHVGATQLPGTSWLWRL